MLSPCDLYPYKAMKSRAAGHLIFTRIQGPSRNVLGVVIKKQFKTRQPFNKATSRGKFNSHPLKK